MLDYKIFSVSPFLLNFPSLLKPFLRCYVLNFYFFINMIYLTWSLVSPEEIRQWYQGFMKDCPTGKLQCSEFAKIYQVFYPSGDPKLFSTFVFNLFDRNGDGSIEFDEFLTALSITSRGTAKEKLNCKS